LKLNLKKDDLLL